MKIIAKGKINNKTETVVFENGRLKELNLLLETLLETPEPLGGTYWPEKYDPLNVYYTLKDRYFDKLESIEIEGDLGEIPQPAGSNAIY